MEVFEQIAFNASNLISKTCLSYVDIFNFWPRGFKILNHLNSLHSDIKLTLKIQSNFHVFYRFTRPLFGLFGSSLTPLHRFVLTWVFSLPSITKIFGPEFSCSLLSVNFWTGNLKANCNTYVSIWPTTGIATVRYNHLRCKSRNSRSRDCNTSWKLAIFLDSNSSQLSSNLLPKCQNYFRLRKINQTLCHSKEVFITTLFMSRCLTEHKHWIKLNTNMRTVTIFCFIISRT